jgi:lipoprotein-anchoring transpeptidase ErfK/SrfK
MTRFFAAFALGLFMLAGSAAAQSVVARVDLSEQRMYVYVGGVMQYQWAVSTARSGYRTPVGTFRPQRMHEMWRSRRYNNAPMPNSIFFYKGWAVHGTTEVANLGRPASHGCVRLHPDNARLLYQLVARNGMGNASIVITR